jgi:hypothetical protein
MRPPRNGGRLGFFIILSCLYLGESPALGQQDTVPEEPTLTVHLTPSEPYLQEEIVQAIRLIAPHPFEELVLDLPPVDGADIVTLQRPKTRKFETYGGEGYIYETSRAIFPRRSGELRIPPVRVSGSIGISRNEKMAFALREDSKTLAVRPPPDSFSEDWWLVASDVSIEESWSKPLDTLRVGDRVTRSIAVAVAGATGAHLPELKQGRSNNLTVLPGRTERDTEISPNGVVGRISRSFDIRIDSEQPINIGPIRIVWWDTSNEFEQRSAAPAVRVEPLARDVDQLVSDAMNEATEAKKNSRRGILAIAFSIGAAALALAFWLARKGRQRMRREDWSLQRDLQIDGSPVNAVRLLHCWKEAAFPSKRVTSLEQLGKELGPTAEQHLRNLQQAAFGARPEPVDASSLAFEVVKIAQKHRRRAMGEAIARWLDYLLGKEQRLPEIDLCSPATPANPPLPPGLSTLPRKA